MNVLKKGMKCENTINESICQIFRKFDKNKFEEKDDQVFDLRDKSCEPDSVE